MYVLAWLGGILWHIIFCGLFNDNWLIGIMVRVFRLLEKLETESSP